MNKLTLIHLLLIVICLSVGSCSSLNKFGNQQKFLYKTVVVSNDESISVLSNDVLYVVGINKENCFTDSKKGDVITVEASNLNKALNYFYKNKAIWDIKEVKTANGNQARMFASNSANVEYEVAYCTFKYLGFITESYDYASFRLVSPDQ